VVTNLFLGASFKPNAK